MKVLVDIGHPAHVHYFKNMIWDLEGKGHSVRITARDKDCTLQLLDAYSLEYNNLGKSRKGAINKIIRMIKFDWNLYNVAKKFKPDIIVSFGSPYASQVSRVIGKPSIVFDDTEHSREQYWLYAPFTDVICTPSCFRRELGSKHVRFNGYMELCYLHPNYFKPNPSILEELNLGRDEKFFILRFVSWGASHDVGHRGFTDKQGLVKNLEKHSRVFITCEKPLAKEFEKYRLSVPPERMHDLLYYATMYIGEGATMATEAGILGTPSVYISSLAGSMGNFDELEREYGLVYSFINTHEALDKAISLLETKNLKRDWQKKKEKLIREKIDVTRWMTGFIENYPKSFEGYIKATNV